MNITLHGKRVNIPSYGNVFELRVLKGGVSGLFSWSLNSITCILIRGRQRKTGHTEERQCEDSIDRDVAKSQGMPIVTISREEARHGFSPRDSERNAGLPTLSFQPSSLQK